MPNQLLKNFLSFLNDFNLLFCCFSCKSFMCITMVSNFMPCFRNSCNNIRISLCCQPRNKKCCFYIIAFKHIQNSVNTSLWSILSNRQRFNVFFTIQKSTVSIFPCGISIHIKSKHHRTLFSIRPFYIFHILPLSDI